MRSALVLVAALGACAQAPLEQENQALPREESVVPGTIGVVVRQQGTNVIVAAVGKASAERGVRVGDVVLRYNGEPVTSPRQFYRLVVDSAPGSRADLEVLREGASRTLELPVRELDLMPRV